MDSYLSMIIALGLIGLMLSVGALVNPIVGPVGVVIALLPAIIIYIGMRRTGTLYMTLPQKKGNVLVLYITGTRRIFPLIGKEAYERYVKLPGWGRIRVSRDSDYYMFGKKVLIAKAGAAHSIPVEMADYAATLRDLGYKNLEEAKKAYKKMKEGDKK